MSRHTAFILGFALMFGCDFARPPPEVSACARQALPATLKTWGPVHLRDLTVDGALKLKVSTADDERGIRERWCVKAHAIVGSADPTREPSGEVSTAAITERTSAGWTCNAVASCP